MKKLTFVALMALLLLPVSAMALDIEQGKIEVTGSSTLDFNWTSAEGNHTDAYTLDLEAQYYVIKNLAVGALLSWSDIDNDTMWLLGPQVTYNISYDDKISFFVNGAVGLVDTDYDDGFFFRVGGGVKYFLTRSVALVGQLRYHRFEMDKVDSDNLNLNFGISVIF